MRGYFQASISRRGFRSIFAHPGVRKSAGAGVHGAIESLEARQVLTGLPVISEVLAANDRVIVDQDGDDSDFIELHNVGDSDMSLNRYYLTDDPDDLQKWRFPDVPLGAGEYLVVFASNKDRNDPNDELHTNFRISASGEYLAVVEPDGQTVAFEFSPGIPRQVQDVSYGIPTGIDYSTFIGPNAPGRVLIPTDGSLDPTEPDVVAGTWLDPELDDSAAGWMDATTGVGYVPPNDPLVLADSVAEFSGVQGQDNWYYGTWTKNFDSDGIYASSEFASLNQERFFVPQTNLWDVGPNGSSPSTEISATGGHPATSNGGFLSVTNWALRRWVSETEGEITISGTLANPDASGDGVVGRIFVNGTEVFQQEINGDSTTYELTTTVAVGDLVDFAIDAGAADDEVGDGTTFTAQIVGIPVRELPTVALADSSDDWVREEQGTNNWFYGYYDALSDPDGTYQPDQFQAFSPAFWARTYWISPTTGVETQVRSTSMQGHADANNLQWAVRRWESPVDGTLTIEYDFSKSQSGGDGTTAHLFHNGVEVDTVQIAGDDRTGTTRVVTLTGVQRGDAIDFAVDPLGPGADPQQPDSDGDRASVDIRISRVADLGENIRSDIRTAMQGISSSAYLRIPFTVADVGALDELTLDVKYDDGFVAYINGRELPPAISPTWSPTIRLPPRLGRRSTQRFSKAST